MNSGYLFQHLLWISDGSSARQFSLLLCRRLHRHPYRRSAGNRTDRNDVHSSSRHVWRSPGDRGHHAGRNLLRGYVRRLDHLYSGQHPGRGRIRDHLHRRIPDGQTGESRTGPRNIGNRIIHRRDLQHCRPHVPGHPLGQGGRKIRASGIFHPDVPWDHDRHLSGQGLFDQSGDHGHHRPHPRVCGNGYDFGEIPL